VEVVMAVAVMAGVMEVAARVVEARVAVREAEKVT